MCDHAHVPCSTDCGRCAVCLRSLDCAPHLPIAPSPTTAEWSLNIRKRIASGNPLPEPAYRTGRYLALRAVQGGR